MKKYRMFTDSAACGTNMWIHIYGIGNHLGLQLLISTAAEE